MEAEPPTAPSTCTCSTHQLHGVERVVGHVVQEHGAGHHQAAAQQVGGVDPPARACGVGRVGCVPGVWVCRKGECKTWSRTGMGLVS